MGCYSGEVRICFIGFCVGWTSFLLGADHRVSLLVAERESSCALLGYYKDGVFEVAGKLKRSDPDWFFHAADEVLKSFRLNEVLLGVDQNGRKRSAVVQKIEPRPELGFFAVELGKDGWGDATVALLGQRQIPMRLLKHRRGSLPAGLDMKLRDEVKVLLAKHRKELPPGSRSELDNVLEPEVISLREAPRVLLVRYPLSLVDEGGSLDKSAQAFFLVDLPTQRIIRGEFGHPEWSSGSTVLKIVPEMFFRLAGSPRIYFLAAYATGWEDVGRHAIFDLATGQEVLHCY